MKLSTFQVFFDGTVHRIRTLARTAMRAVPSSGLRTFDNPPVKVKDRAMAAAMADEHDQDNQLGIFPTIEATAKVETLG